MASSSGGQRPPKRSFFTMADGLTDNVVLLEFVEQSRRTLHAGALELGITASEIEAKLRRHGRGITIGGLTAGHRARQVARPIQQASEALVIASQYIITAGNRFEAVYGHELEQVGYQGRRSGSDFRFKAR